MTAARAQALPRFQGSSLPLLSVGFRCSCSSERQRSDDKVQFKRSKRQSEISFHQASLNIPEVYSESGAGSKIPGHHFVSAMKQHQHDDRNICV